METFLTPIEKPDSFKMKLAYFFTKKQFGKVLMPLKVHSARLPIAFGMFYGKVAELDKKLTLPRETVLLIRQHVAQLNTCLFCMDASRAASIKASMNEEKFNALASYGASPIFSEAEKAALDYVSELTKDKKAGRQTFDTLARFFSAVEICEIVYLVSSEHLFNLTNIGLNIHSDMLCDISKSSKKTA